MRKLIVSNMISLDGFYEGPGANVMALPFDAGFSAYNLERLRQADTLLLGRDSFDGFRRYWPMIQDDDTAPPIEREISRRNNAIEKIVVSGTLEPTDLVPWSDTRIVRPGDVRDALTELKQREGADILIFGSRRLWNALLSDGLVDELHLMVGAGLIGGGTSVFEGDDPVALRLIEHRQLPDSQLVLLRYAPAG